MTQNRFVRKYLRQVRGMLPCSLKMKKHTMMQLQNEIFLFLEESPQGDYAALVSRFGKPEKIAASYVEDMGTAEILKKLRIRKRIVCLVAILLILALITWGIAVKWALYNNDINNGGYSIVEIY